MKMPLSRRQMLFSGAAAAVFGQEKRVIPWYEEPALGIHKKVKTAVRIRSVELLRVGSNYFLQVTSEDGAKGICRTKQMEDYIAILMRRVVPTFIGKDARDIETLVDDVYTANYKLAGQAFWCPVAYVEQAIFDLLGKTAGLPVGELLGGVIRKEIPVYLSGSGRDTTAEEEVDVYVRGVAETKAKAVKFKIGGRMSRNLDAYPGRTETLMKLARKRLGDAVIINADANGSYNAEKAIAVGRMRCRWRATSSWSRCRRGTDWRTSHRYRRRRWRPNRCCCWRTGTACAIRRSRCAACWRGNAGSKTASPPPACTRWCRWWPAGWVSRCCRAWRWRRASRRWRAWSKRVRPRG